MVKVMRSTNKIAEVGRHCYGRRGMDTKEWSSYCWSRRMSTPTAQIRTAGHHLGMLLSKGTRK